MKKFFVIALAAISLSMVSCKSAEEKQCEAYVEQLNKAMEADDTEGAIKAAHEMKDWMAGLSADQQANLDKALGEDGKAAMEQLLGMVDLLESLQNFDIEEPAEDLDEAADELEVLTDDLDETEE